MTICENIINNISLEKFNFSIDCIGKKLGVGRHDMINIMNNIEKFKSLKGVGKAAKRKRRFIRHFQCIDRMVVYIKKEIEAGFFVEYDEIIKRNVSSKEYKNHLDGENSESVKELMHCGRKIILPEKRHTKISQNPVVNFIPKSEYSR